MGSETLHPVVTRLPAQRSADRVVRAMADQSIPDEPTAVLVVGAHESGKRELIRALLRIPNWVVDVPAATYLVLAHGHVGTVRAYLPGRRQPQPYGSSAGGTLTRPPRRVERTVPDPLLRHFTLVEAPCVRRLGVGGASVLADAAERGGAVVFITTTTQPLTRSELDLLALLASREVTVFFAIVPDGAVPGPRPSGSGDGGETLAGSGAVAPDPHDDDYAPHLAMEAHRTAVASHAPGLARAPWFTVDPAAGDIAFLRRALVEWAGAEGLRRASDNPPVLPISGAVRVGDEATESGWSTALDRWLRSSTRRVRQRLAIEVAGIHLRCVQDIVFGAGCAGMPETLDHELHALSLRATRESDTAVAGVVYDVLLRVLAREPTEDVRRRVCAAVRRGLADSQRELARVLMVSGTGAVTTVGGRDALAALPGYVTATASPVLAPVGLAVSDGCYTLWRDPANADVGKARCWLQRVTRAVELELSREVARRFEAVHRSLGGLITETIDHGILLA